MLYCFITERSASNIENSNKLCHRNKNESSEDVLEPSPGTCSVDITACIRQWTLCNVTAV
jgi:hypothetical protein